MKIQMILKIGLILLTFGMASFSIVNDEKENVSARVETFTFSSKGLNTRGKVYLPDAYTTDSNLPAIYLVDFAEQHFKLATDEFERVIEGVRNINGFDALVVSLESIPDLDAEPGSFEEHYEIYKNMASFVDDNYTNNTTRTFIGRGSEAGLVLMALFFEHPESANFNNFIVTDPSPKYVSAIIDLIEKDNIPESKSNRKLHYSFSSSNDRAKCLTLIDLIKDTNYEWLEFESKEYTKSDYENTYPESYAEGIRYIFSK